MRHDLDFERLFAFVDRHPIHWLHRRLVELGKWPYERLPIRILRPEDAAERLKDRNLASLALIKAIIVIEAHDSKLYTARTADVAWGLHKAHHVDIDDEMADAVLDTFGKSIEA